MAEEEKVLEAEIVDKAQGQKVKKSPLVRFKETFFVSSKEEIKRFLIEEVVKPGVRDIISDVINRGTDMALYGDGGRRRSGGRSWNGSTRSYSEYYERRNGSQKTIKTSSGYNCDPIKFDNQFEANDVLDWCAMTLDEYEVLSVYQFYDRCGVTVDHTDHNWGWNSLEGFRTVKDRGGWCIYPPKPSRIKD